MPLKKSAGNMYEWVTHTHSHLGGLCSHLCTYCYVQAMAGRFSQVAAKYSGAPRLLPGELTVQYGAGRTIFVEHMADLFAADVPSSMIDAVLAHCNAWPRNTYVLQSKNPARMADYLAKMPPTVILGTTIETNRPTPKVSKAPTPRSRFEAMLQLRAVSPARIFVTVEPILQFDLSELAQWLTKLRPDFLNIGADSKARGLAEPTQTEVLALVAELRHHGIEVREKHNLQRLLVG